VGRNNHINWLLDLFTAISILSGTYPDHAQGVCLHGTTPPQIACNPQEWGKKSFPFFSEYQ